jgi:hypothetical protein
MGTLLTGNADLAELGERRNGGTDDESDESKPGEGKKRKYVSSRLLPKTYQTVQAP